MPQNIILKNLIKFVELNEKKFSNELKTQLAETKDPETREKLERELKKHQAEFPAYFKELAKKLPEGMCMGFSICHDLMDEESELEWWEGALRLVADWKNEPLENEIILANKKKSTRSQLFERVFNYIYFPQPGSLSSFSIDNMSQTTLLKPIESKSLQTHYTLDYLDRKGHIKTIQKNVVIAGSFTIEQLEKILKPNLREKILGVAHSKFKQHVVRIGKKNKEFILYNANYDHTTPFSWLNYLPIVNFSKTPPIYKKFKSLNEMLKELITIQGDCLGIELASFNSDEIFDMSYYDELVSTSPHLLIKDGGLHHIALYNPTLCKTIIAKTPSSAILKSTLAVELERPTYGAKNTGFHYILRYVSEVMDEILLLAEHKSDKNIRQALVNNLLSQNLNDDTYLHLLAHTPKILQKFLSLAEDKEGTDIRQKLPKALSLQNDDGWTGLHEIAYHSPDALSNILRWASDVEGVEFRQELANALTLKNDDGWTGLHMIIYHSPEMIPTILSLVENKKGNFRKQFLHALSLQNSNGYTGFHLMVRYSPEGFSKLLNLAENKEGIDIRNELINALSLKDSKGWTVLHMIVRSAPDALSKLLSLASDVEAINIRLKIAEALPLQTIDGWTVLHMIAYYSHEALAKLLNLAISKEGLDIRQKFANALLLKNSSGCTGLHMIAYRSPRILPTFLSMIEDEEGLDIRQQFITALTLKNSDHITVLNFIDEDIPELLPKLIKLIEQDEQLIAQFNNAIRYSKNLKSDTIKKYIIRHNIHILEAKEQEAESKPIVIPDNKPLLKPNYKPADTIQEKKQTIKTQNNYYSRFFQPILMGASVIIGGATAGLGGAIIFPTTTYFVPKAQNALSENCRKPKI